MKRLLALTFIIFILLAAYHKDSYMTNFNQTDAPKGEQIATIKTNKERLKFSLPNLFQKLQKISQNCRRKAFTTALCFHRTIDNL